MGIPKEALDLENQNVGRGGKPTLWAAYEILRERWRAGDRDRELGLHIMFLTWYMLCEPPFLTGLPHDSDDSLALAEHFNEVHRHFSPSIMQDAEMLYVVGLMANLFPWLLGDEQVWNRTSETYRRAYRRLTPNGVDPGIFEGRGAYGDYFGGQARVVGGY